jgi:hypothetical protein
VDKVVVVGIKAVGNTVWFFRDGAVSPAFTAAQEFPLGRVVLGIVPRGSAVAPPFEATFTNVELKQAART